MRNLVIFLALLGFIAALPASDDRPVAMYVSGTAPGSTADAHQAMLPIGLPGFDNLMPNRTALTTTTASTTFQQHGGWGPGPFDGRCVMVTLGGHGRIGQATLEALCEDDAGKRWQTSLNLNQCVGNHAGQLVFEDFGHFDSSCRPCTLDGNEQAGDVLLKCSCLDQARMPRYTFLELGPYVRDVNAVKLVDGRFVCGNRQGSKSPTF